MKSNLTGRRFKYVTKRYSLVARALLWLREVGVALSTEPPQTYTVKVEVLPTDGDYEDAPFIEYQNRTYIQFNPGDYTK